MESTVHNHGGRTPTHEEVESMCNRVKDIAYGKSDGIIILMSAKKVNEDKDGFGLSSEGTAYAHGLPKRAVVRLLGNTLKQMGISPAEFLVADLLEDL